VYALVSRRVFARVDRQARDVPGVPREDHRIGVVRESALDADSGEKSSSSSSSDTGGGYSPATATFTAVGYHMPSI
jgi:hypothetical protein